MPPSVRTVERLDTAQLTAVQTLIADSSSRSGRDPLSDEALTKLTSTGVVHVLAQDGARIVGYAQRDGDSLELVGADDALVPLLDACAGRLVRVWSHGGTSPVAAALRTRDFHVVRELYQLRRPLDAPLALRAVPAGVDVRPFRVGLDEDAWLAVNAAAFAHHPEQGGWTRADLDAREHETWFDPSGLLMAWRGDELVGFHWTKRHTPDLGEVYVLAVAPSGQGLGLGTVLLLLGLDSLRTRGCREALLYVDGDNATARALYARHGFVEHDVDLQWAP